MPHATNLRIVVTDNQSSGGHALDDRVTHADAVTGLLRTLTGLKGWFREIQQGVYDGHSAAELLLLALVERQGPARVTALADAARCA